MVSKLLILGTVFPEPDSSAAGGRMMQLIDLFQQHGWDITFASAAAESEYATDLTEVGVQQASVQLNHSSFDDLIRELDPQMVLFDRFMTEEQFGWRVAENCPNAIRILDTEDLHCLRHARQEALKENRELQPSDLFNEVARREIASIYRCDLSLIISEYEMEVLKTTFNLDDALLHHLPFMLDLINNHPASAGSAQIDHPDPSGHPSQPDCVVRAGLAGGEWHLGSALVPKSEPSTSSPPLGGGVRGGAIPFEDRQHFVTIGNFLHPPNWDSVQYLKTNIWPLIRERLPEAEMHVYGAYCSVKHLKLHSERDGFLIKGRAQDAKMVIGKARVLLAPLRFGAGLKGKLVEAMQCGTPSVTTPIGAEAMHADLPWSGAVADSARTFAEAAIQLYNGKGAWESAQQNGWEIIRQVYPKKKLSEAFIQRFEELRVDLENHRQRNFIGAMLMHHTMRSTEFMSRWIEAKNRVET